VSNCFESVEIIDEAYLRAHPTGSMAENYATVYTAGNIVTGQYFAIKYRIPTTNQSNKYISIYTSTTGTDGMSKHCLQLPVTNDGEWHIAIIDVSLGGSSDCFTLNEDEKYVASYLRLDILDYHATADEYIDIAAVYMGDDLTAMIKHDQSVDTVEVFDALKKAYTEYSSSTADAIESEAAWKAGS
jgi:hypothetical protein